MLETRVSRRWGAGPDALLRHGTDVVVVDLVELLEER